MPALGMAQETGKILRWLKAAGDPVSKGEALMEIETDKVTVEVEAPAAGTLAAIRAGEGEDVPVGVTVALILGDGEAAPQATAARDGAASAPVRREVTAPAVTGTSEPARRRLASPKARRLAAELGIEIDGLNGSGPGGAVIAADVASARPGRPVRAVPAVPGEELPTGSVWRVMAERTTASWREVPHFFLTREVDAGGLERWRAAARRRPGGEGVTHTDLLVRIVASALAGHPRVNASYRDGSIVGNSGVNVGIAVALDDGLVVPVVHGADGLGVLEIAQRRRELVEAARRGALRPEDVAGGTFTISNLGMFGVDAFSAIVNAPQAAILAVGRVADRVVPVDGRPEVRPMLVLTASFDHRVVDGAGGARFLQTLAALAEEPLELLS